jgi:hypothetical protein
MMHTLIHRTTSASIVLLLALLACAMPRGEAYPVFDYGRFKEERAKWSAVGPRAYSFRYTSKGRGFMDYDVTVAPGTEPVTVARQGSLPPGNLFTRTIDQVFDSIEETYLSETRRRRDPHAPYIKEIQVWYDPQYGFPARVAYSYSIPHDIQVDGNCCFEIGEFRPLGANP